VPIAQERNELAFERGWIGGGEQAHTASFLRGIEPATGPWDTLYLTGYCWGAGSTMVTALPPTLRIAGTKNE